MICPVRGIQLNLHLLQCIQSLQAILYLFMSIFSWKLNRTRDRARFIYGFYPLQLPLILGILVFGVLWQLCES